jgi:hypothetical protein
MKFGWLKWFSLSMAHDRILWSSPRILTSSRKLCGDPRESHSSVLHQARRMPTILFLIFILVILSVLTIQIIFHRRHSWRKCLWKCFF